MHNYYLNKKNLSILSFLIIFSIQFIFAGGNSEEIDNTEEIISEIDNIEILEESNVIISLSYPIVDTGQVICSNNNNLIDFPEPGDSFFGQDAQYDSVKPSYTDNGDGTITDNITGLIWTQELSPSSMNLEEAKDYVNNLNLAGITEWRIPTQKELWSIKDFSKGWPWLDSNYFYLCEKDFEESQQGTWSSDTYLKTTNINKDNKKYVRCVSGKIYGENNFVVNKEGTVKDNATGLMWAQEDSQKAMNWDEALSYAEQSQYAGYNDWRLPNIKELQSIVDYSENYPLIDTDVFNISSIINKEGNSNYPNYWTNTTTANINQKEIENGFTNAWYIAFGNNENNQINNIMKTDIICFGEKVQENPTNYVRLVRGGNVSLNTEADYSDLVIDRINNFKDNDSQNMNSKGQGPMARGENMGSEKGRPEGPPPNDNEKIEKQGPDFSAAAIKLGISEQELIDAFGEPTMGQPDFEAIANKLNISVDDLLEALGMNNIRL